MFNIICICTGNICRSPMAEGLLKALLPEALQNRVHIRSAGTHALHGNVAENNAVVAMKSFGVDISRHRARVINGDDIKTADLVLTMEKGHVKMIQSAFKPRPDALHLLGAFDEDGSLEEIDDPYGQSLAVYMNCAREIHACVTGVIRHLGELHGIDPQTNVYE